MQTEPTNLEAVVRSLLPKRPHEIELLDLPYIDDGESHYCFTIVSSRQASTVTFSITYMHYDRPSRFSLAIRGALSIRPIGNYSKFYFDEKGNVLVVDHIGTYHPQPYSRSGINYVRDRRAILKKTIE
jgi:hypothetical protein